MTWSSRQICANCRIVVLSEVSTKSERGETRRRSRVVSRAVRVGLRPVWVLGLLLANAGCMLWLVAD